MTTPDYPVPAGSAVTTPNEMLAEIRAVHTEVAGLKPLIERALAAVPDHEERLRKLESATAPGGEVALDVKDHESRIRSLERVIWRATGFAAGGGGIVGALLTKLIGGAA
jgi:hypothetical protein